MGTATSLKTVTFNKTLMDRYHVSFNWIASILDNIRSSTFTKVIIHLVTSKQDDIVKRTNLDVLAIPFKRNAMLAKPVMLEFQLSGLDVSLDARRYAMLDGRFSDVLELDLVRERFKASIANLLPELSSEGRLIFS